MTTAAAVVPGYCALETCECHTVEAKRIQTPWPADLGFPPYCCNRCARHGPRPVTIVPPAMAISNAEIAARVMKTRTEHGATLDAFHQVWYDCGHTWSMTNFLGVAMMKNPMDLWAYHDLIVAQRPTCILETGTFAGGSALWFAFLMDILNIEGGKVLTVDLDDHRQVQHPRIVCYGGDSTDPEVASALRAEVTHPLLVTLDSDHSSAHVLKELRLYAPAVKVGEYLVVEDTNISWGDERGARGGVEDYCAEHPGEFRQDLLCEKQLLTMHPGGWLQRMAPHRHHG